MKTIEEIHRANLQALAAEFGGVTAVAAVIGCSSSQYSQWMNGSENSGTGKPRGMRPSSARRIERACSKPEGWMDREHTPTPPKLALVEDDGFITSSSSMPEGAQRAQVADTPLTIPVRAVTLRLQAGVSGFAADTDFSVDHGYFPVPLEVIEQLNLRTENLMIMTVKGRSMEPMYFEDDKVLVDTSRQTPRNNECFAVNWNGEALIKSLIKKTDGWALYSFNRDFPTVSVRTGQCSIIGQVVWQPARVVMGRL